MSTTLATITDDLKGFSQSSWVITAYLITYTGKLSSLALDQVAADTLERPFHHMGQIERHLWPKADIDNLARSVHCVFGSVWGSADDHAIVG